MRGSRREPDDSDGAGDLDPDLPMSVPDVIDKLGDLAATAGLRRVAILAWRDLDDPEAGGSELHASRVASLWAQAGIEVTMRTSYAAGHPQVTWRNGYRVIRKAGRYLVFPRAAFSEMMGWHGASDGLVEIWNGMPFFSPLWTAAADSRVAAPRARLDVGDDAPARSRPGRSPRSSSASRRASTAARRSSRSRTPRKDELVAQAALAARSASPSCRPASIRRSRRAARARPTPLVVAVGRLVPGEAFRPSDRRAGDGARNANPRSARSSSARATSAKHSKRRSRELGAEDWISLPGRVEPAPAGRPLPAGVGAGERVGARGLGDDDHRGGRVRHAHGRDPYRRPRRRGRARAHRPARRRSGAARRRDRARDRRRRRSASLLSAGALRHATRFTWAATARGTLEVLADEALRRRRS